MTLGKQAKGRLHHKFVDVDGRVFGKLTVVSSATGTPRKALVRCLCGLEFQTRKEHLLSGQSTSCGKGQCSAKTEDLSGRKFGYLTAVKHLKGKTAHGYGTLWACRCDCGKSVNVVAQSLKTGNTKSCGCKSHDMSAAGVIKPGNWASITAIMLRCKAHAKTRNVSFSLSRDEVQKLVLLPCHYCGHSGKNSMSTHGGGKFKHNGIDRKLSDLGYELDNCVPCCKDCNRAKRELPYEDFLNLVRLIASRFPANDSKMEIKAS